MSVPKPLNLATARSHPHLSATWLFTHMAQAVPTYVTTPAASAMADARAPSYDQPLTALFVVSGLLYLGIYAVEAPIRFGLLWAGKDQFILARDLLIFGPLLALLV